MLKWKDSEKVSICSMPNCERFALDEYKTVKLCYHCKEKIVDEQFRLESERITPDQVVWQHQFRKLMVGEEQ